MTFLEQFVPWFSVLMYELLISFFLYYVFSFRFMPTDSLWKRPIIKGIKFGVLTLFISYLPTFLVCLVESVLAYQWPSFEYAFNSGGMISIWIPIMVMLVVSFHEMHGLNAYPGLEGIAFFVVLILLIAWTALYPFFFFSYIPYAAWVKWASYAIIIILFLSLCLSKYLESTMPLDLQSSRAKDQENLENKAKQL